MTVPSTAARAIAFPAFALVLTLILGGCSHAPETTVTPPPPATREVGKTAARRAREPVPDKAVPTRDEAEVDEAEDEEDADKDGAQIGLASYYATKFEGRRTASGDVYRRDAMTAAHRSLPFGTRVRVTRVTTGKSVELVINDRGPFIKGRIVDVSRRAAEQLDLVRVGLARVRLDVLERSAD